MVLGVWCKMEERFWTRKKETDEHGWNCWECQRNLQHEWSYQLDIYEHAAFKEGMDPVYLILCKQCYEQHKDAPGVIFSKKWPPEPRTTQGCTKSHKK